MSKKERDSFAEAPRGGSGSMTLAIGQRRRVRRGVLTTEGLIGGALVMEAVAKATAGKRLWD